MQDQDGLGDWPHESSPALNADAKQLVQGCSKVLNHEVILRVVPVPASKGKHTEGWSLLPEVEQWKTCRKEEHSKLQTHKKMWSDGKQD